MISKETADLLFRLRDLGAEIWLEGDRVAYAEGSVPPDLAAQIEERREEIVAFLGQAVGAAATAETAEPAIARLDRDGPLPVSFAQRRLWVLHRMGESSAAYNMLLCVRLRGELDAAALEASLGDVMARHESLRTSFEEREGEPIQVVSEAQATALPVVDLSGESDPLRAAVERAEKNAEVAFDLSSPPLLAAELLVVGAREHVLSITLAHIIADGWSADVLWRELAACYTARRGGQPARLEPLEIQYADYAAWQATQYTERSAQLLAFWKGALSDLPTLDLPTDRQRPLGQSFAGGRHGTVVGRETRDALSALASAEGCSLFMAMLAAFKVMLARYSGQEDIVVGTPVANRERVETEALIGLFVNSLVLRTDLAGDPSFREMLRRVRDGALAAFEHQAMPFEQLVVELRPERDVSRNPLFQVMCNYVGASTAWEGLDGVSVEEVDLANPTSKFDLTLAIQEVPDGLKLDFEYASDLFDHATVARMAEQLVVLLHSVVEDPDDCVWRRPMLTPQEQELFLSPLALSPYPDDRCLHTLVEEQAARTPDAIAVEFEGETLTYAELNARANQLAHHLRDLGAQPERLVGLSVERSVFMPIGMLGILKSGAAYVPMDPAYPTERLAFMLEDASADLFVTQESVLGTLPAELTRPVLLDVHADAIAKCSTENPELRTHAESLAHLIYSSGSTGRPKGALIRHRSLCNVFWAFADRPGITGDDVLVAVTNIAFDLAGLDMFLPLVVGARLVIAPKETVADGRKLSELLERCGATFLDATPSMWRLLVESGWPGKSDLRCVTGGEMMPRDLADRLDSTCRDLWDCYAPCETTIYSTRYKYVPGGPLSVGRPLSNTEIYLLDEHGQPVPTGVTGDIHIGGHGLSRGYLNRDELTAERFVRHPFSSDPSARLYRTGDLARWLPDGNLVLGGRADHQIKLRGFRIELGEIEHVLSRVSSVKECAVVARVRETGDQQLVGYVVFRPGQSSTVSELREALRDKLPEFMIPSGFAILDELPLTPNRKVDRKALSQSEQALAVGAEAFVAPRSDMEKMLARVWSEVLGVERVGVHDNFFDLGGHSLLAMKVVYAVQKEIGHEIMPMDLLLETLEQLARTCEKRVGVSSAPESAPAAAVDVEVRPLFFGRSGRELYGVYQPPRRDAAPDVGILLCQGLGHEYIAAHGSMHSLADRFARAGYPSLRFDYFGCGNSAGTMGEVSWEHWIDDVTTAAGELCEASGATRVCIVGLRIGATLAALAGARMRAAGKMVAASVLWEPISRGADHVDELLALQESWVLTTFVRRKAIHTQGGPQVLGFELPEALQAELRAVDLTRLDAAPADRTLVLQNVEESDFAGLAAQLQRSGEAAHEVIESAPPWVGEHGRTIAIASPAVLQRIVSWVEEVVQ